MSKRFKGNLATKIDAQSRIVISDFYDTMSKFTVHITYQVVSFSRYIGYLLHLHFMKLSKIPVWFRMDQIPKFIISLFSNYISANSIKVIILHQEKPTPNIMKTHPGYELSFFLGSITPINQELKRANSSGTYLQVTGCCIHLEEGGHEGHGGEAGKVLRWLVERVMGRVRLDSESCVHSLSGRDMRGYWWSCFRTHRMEGALGWGHITPGFKPKLER